MTARFRSLSVSLMLAAAVAVATSYSLKASPQPGQAQDPLPALLAEVHALRIAMEQSATVAPRVQLTLARLNIEEQRISQLGSQLEQTRRELSAVSMDIQRLSDRVPDLEKGLLTATEDKTRKQYEFEQRETKRRLAEQSRLEQQLRARENEATQTISAEQARWTDLNARLDELERLLGPAPR